VEEDIENKEGIVSKMDEIDWEGDDFEDWPQLNWP